MSGPVVVGVNGSQSGMASVEAAAHEADRSGVELRLAYAYEWPTAQVSPGVPPWDRSGAGACRVVKGALTEAERWAVGAAPQLRVTHEVLMGSPVAVLESASREASLLVVGGRPPGGAGSLRRGSVAGQLAAHGRTPMLVVRGRPDPAGPVVLVGGHAQEVREAVEFAYAEAAARDTDLVVLERTTAWHGRSYDAFAEALSVQSGKHPDVTTHRARARGGLGRALVEASTRAQLIVVGTRGRGRRTGALPTPVGMVALHRSDCPVAVVHSAER